MRSLHRTFPRGDINDIGCSQGVGIYILLPSQLEDLLRASSTVMELFYEG